MESELIKELEKEIENNNETNIVDTIETIKDKGLPLIEKKEGTYLLTFLFKGQDLQNVAVVGSYPGFNLNKQKLELIENSSYWYKTYQLDQPINFTYGFVKDFKTDKKDFDMMGNIIKDPFNEKEFTVHQSQDQVLNLAVCKMVKNKAVDQYFQQESKEKLPVTEHYLDSSVLEEKRKYWLLESEEDSNYDGVFLCTDGYTYINDQELLQVLHNLRKEKLIPNLLFLFIENKERTSELAANSNFKNFLTKEIMEQVFQKHGIKLDPTQNVICGKSLGGLNALYTAVSSDLFKNIISHSGTFIWNYQYSREPDYIFEEIGNSDFQAKNIYLDVGVLEDQFVPSWFMSLIGVNKRMKETLKEKSDNFYFNIFKGGHEYYCWRQNMIEALLEFFN
ncbi:MAG: alpha/beta hydrolase-fold protein [Halanaerobiales bacterium]